MAQFGRPASTITSGSWTANGGPSTLWECVDESSASDTDYCRITGANNAFEVKFSSLLDPNSSSTHVLRWRERASGSGSAERLTVALYQGTTLIATAKSNATVTRSVFTALSYTLTSGQADSITDYTDLRVRFTTGALTGGETVDVSWTELEVPDAIISGTLSKTLGTLTSSATGTVALKGTASKTLGALTSTATGKVALTGTASKTLGTLTSSATGKVALAGTVSKTLGALTLVATGTLTDPPRQGVVNATLGALTGTATGTVALAGVVSRTLGALTSTATGTLAIAGTTSKTLGTLTSTATGKVALVGATSQTLGTLTGNATGSLTIKGTASPTLGALTLVATGTISGGGANSGVLNATLGVLTGNATGTLALRGQLSATLGVLTGVATGVSIDPNAEYVTATIRGAGRLGQVGMMGSSSTLYAVGTTGTVQCGGHSSIIQEQ